jgi:hypothetical protein
VNLEQAVTICPSPAALVARDTRRADEVADAIKKLDGQLQHSTFDVADLLAEAKREAHWATLSHESFEDFIKALGIEKSKREVEYLVRMSEVLTKLGTTRKQAVAAKVSKLREIARLDPSGQIVDPDTEIAEPMSGIMKRLIESAPVTPLAEIKQQVNDLIGKSGGDESELTWWNMPIRRDAKEMCLETVDLVMALSGDTVDVNTGKPKPISIATAVERIFADFRSDPNNQLEQLGQAGDYADSIEDGDSHEDALESEVEE